MFRINYNFYEFQKLSYIINFDKKIKISVDLKLILSQYKYFKITQIPHIYYPIPLMYNIEQFFFKKVAHVLR